MMAVYEGREELARKLVGLGADRSIRNDRGDGALEWAMKHKHLGIARLVSDPQQFATAASLPKQHWGEPVRSVSAAQTQAPAASEKIEQLLSIRNILAARGPTNSVDKLDRRIAALRAKPQLDKRPAAILEISASRRAPHEQKARLITEPGAK